MELLDQQLAAYCPLARSSPLPAFVNEVWLEHSHAHSCTGWDCLGGSMAELSNCIRDLMARKLNIFTFWKSLLVSFPGRPREARAECI